MASQPAFQFDNFLPGFDFLKQFAQANPAAAMPTASQWITPTLDPEELDKRIQELKSVQFWLDQNAKALTATIQAMEVQRMTLSTLQSMNLGMADQAATKDAAPAVDPMQWWGAISQQFQTIAAQAVKDMQQHASPMQPAAKPTQPRKAKATAKTTTQTAAKKAVGPTSARQPSSRKTAR